MTEQELRQQVIAKAKSWLGVVQGDAKHKALIDTYNAHQPRAGGYAVKYTDPWCATYVSTVAIQLGLTDIIPTECSCSRMIQLYKNHGDSRWEEDDAYIPKIGDILMYSWSDTSPATANTNAPDHVGFVAEINNRTMQVIEGNKSRAVGYREMQVNGQYIRGYCLPAYGLKVETPVVGTGDNPSEWAKDATRWAINNKLIAGDGKGNYDWQASVTREALAQVLYNLMNK